jgi:tripartite-type tricarboxylate transporter receptor subunit TctC
MRCRRLGRLLAALWVAVPGATHSLAADYECPRASVIVPYPAGGAADVAARLVADRLEALLKRSFVIENRPGATGNIGTAAVVNGKPDGCTLLVNAAVIATFPSSFSKLAFDPIKDLLPIGGIGITPTLQHLAIEEMSRRADAKFVHVVYKGGAQAATDLIAARVDFGSFAAGSVIQFVKEGQLKPLGVIAERRSSLLPEVATTAEQGLPGVNAGVHFMLYAPAATPREVVAVLNAELNRIVGDPTLKQRFADIGFDPTVTTPDQVAAIMRKTAVDWAPVIKRLNIRLD